MQFFFKFIEKYLFEEKERMRCRVSNKSIEKSNSWERKKKR